MLSAAGGHFEQNRRVAEMDLKQHQDLYSRQRDKMVEEQIVARGIKDEKVLTAMKKVPRHLFVPASGRERAYQDSPLPIGYGQTISQPYIVAYMTEELHLSESDTVLEIGTGSGYQAAVLSEIVAQVYSIEIVKELGERAAKVLKKNQYLNVRVIIGDGYNGLPEHAPFDAIILTAAPAKVPQPLLDQLRDRGRLIAPVGSEYQELRLITRCGKKFKKKSLIPVRFVPMTGKGRKK
ncbi:MAG TPA: protein-L-isoaspartate(D-aspartate) O-methyltransferase [Bacteroidetes bacterium]|nr:protein-L-isoaspartate(D-aspartate) O-methyltransferase [Bacteroidota bacterium]